ncbi:MAG: hypothetical protein HYZ50_13925 [Deltaproteobacteria bacterium]|nr:hypothetical protein [Deltaproteobacteria bacterium]
MKSAPLLFSCVAGALLGATVACAGDMVELRIETVLASNASPYFDTRLEEIWRQVSGTHYNSYRLMQEERRKVEWGNQVDFSLPGGRVLQVVPKQFAAERIALQVMIMEGTPPVPLMKTALSIKNHGTLFFGGRRHQDGTLIIRIGAATDE